MPSLLNRGKLFLHAHGGILPAYRGSTTFYYSLINDSSLGASAILLEEGIDTGVVVASVEFSIKEVKGLIDSSDIDYVVDPWVRSLALVKALRHYVEQGHFELKAQEGEAQFYHKIHPVLKHIALLKFLQN